MFFTVEQREGRGWFLTEVKKLAQKATSSSPSEMISPIVGSARTLARCVGRMDGTRYSSIRYLV